MLNIDKSKFKVLLGVVLAYRKSFFLIFFTYFSFLAFDLYSNGLSSNVIWYMLLLPFLMVGWLIYIVRNFFNMLLNDPVSALMKVSSDVYMYPLEEGLNKQLVEKLLYADEIVLNNSFNKTKVEQSAPNKSKNLKYKNKDVDDAKIK